MALKKVLIANRGEIAIRIARTCKRLGIQTVGIFAAQDQKSLHLNFCDEVFSLGEGTVAQTYLDIPKIISVLKKSKAQAVHPGYGFLSERAAFAEAIQKEKCIFVGPSIESIQSMGDKIHAKNEMKKLGVPLLPSTPHGVQSFSEAANEARRMGYPIVLKAAAGGGGKGMRVVRKTSELRVALENASKEAQNYFGDGTIYIEKFLENPHHIEVQILGDGRGGGGHVFDRECSIQRRHQKLVEESPGPWGLKHPKGKEKLLKVATHVVKKMRYANAGTIEFLGDDHGNFYFLEMNTRLQVEHPVTEWVTGLDLVEWQLRIAMGEKLKKNSFIQKQNGHSIEVRIYAETPFDHLPTSGKIHEVQLPQAPFVRVDSAIYPGYEVLTDYDPTLLKLSVWGVDRPACVNRLQQALSELRILGVENNQGLFWCITHESDFKKGIYGTAYLEKHKTVLKKIYMQELKRILPTLAAAGIQSQTQPYLKNTSISAENASMWSQSSRALNLRGET